MLDYDNMYNYTTTNNNGNNWSEWTSEVVEPMGL